MLTLLYFLLSSRIPSAYTRTALVAARQPARVAKMWSSDLEQKFGGRLNHKNAGLGCRDLSGCVLKSSWGGDSAVSRDPGVTAQQLDQCSLLQQPEIPDELAWGSL